MLIQIWPWKRARRPKLGWVTFDPLTPGWVGRGPGDPLLGGGVISGISGFFFRRFTPKIEDPPLDPFSPIWRTQPRNAAPSLRGVQPSNRYLVPRMCCSQWGVWTTHVAHQKHCTQSDMPACVLEKCWRHKMVWTKGGVGG